MRWAWIMGLFVFLGLGACQAPSTGNPDGGESVAEGNSDSGEPVAESNTESRESVPEGDVEGKELVAENQPETVAENQPETVTENPPETVVAGDCSVEQSCTKPKECISPGPRRKVCGIPPMNECEQDADCQKSDPKAICKEGAGNCGGKGCVAGCKADSECLVGESCKSDGHCKAKECIDNMTCPKNFVCNSNKTCERQSCQKSTECLGFCVNAFCHDQKGTCEEVIPVP